METQELLREFRTQAQGVLQPRGDFIRLSARAPARDLLSLLRASDHESRFYWADKSGQSAFLALGEAQHVNLKDTPAFFSNLPEHARNTRLFGGFAFDESSDQPSSWGLFPRMRFFLPEIEFARTSESAETMKIHLNLRDSGPEHKLASLEAALSRLAGLLAESSPGPRIPKTPDSVRHLPDFEKWTSSVHEAVEAISRHDFSKVVLARETEFRFPSEPDAVGIFEMLRERSTNSSSFFYSRKHQGSFFGASPETLFHRRGSDLSVDVIAGTRKRGSSPAEDKYLATELRENPKDLLEHGLVRDFVLNALSPLSTSRTLTADREILSLSRLLHLYSRVEANLSGESSDSAVIQALHPTPAVCGQPQQAAQQHLKREPFDRGWYAGGIGYLSPAESELTVGIRSAFSRENRILAYTGAGIVAGSEPGKEWEELGHKLSLMQEAIGAPRENL